MAALVRRVHAFELDPAYFNNPVRILGQDYPMTIWQATATDILTRNMAGEGPYPAFYNYRVRVEPPNWPGLPLNSPYWKVSTGAVLPPTVQYYTHPFDYEGIRSTVFGSRTYKTKIRTRMRVRDGSWTGEWAVLQNLSFTGDALFETLPYNGKERLLVIYSLEQYYAQPRPTDGSFPVDYAWPLLHGVFTEIPDPAYPELGASRPIDDTFMPIAIFIKDFQVAYSGPTFPSTQQPWMDSLQGLMGTLNLDAKALLDDFVAGEAGAPNRWETYRTDFLMGFFTDFDVFDGPMGEYNNQFFKQLVTNYTLGRDRYEQWVIDYGQDNTVAPPIQSLDITQGGSTAFAYTFRWSVLEFVDTINNNPTNTLSVPQVTMPPGLQLTQYSRRWTEQVEGSFGTQYHHYLIYMVNWYAGWFINVPEPNDPWRGIDTRINSSNDADNYGVLCPLYWPIVKDMAYGDKDVLLQQSWRTLVFGYNKTTIGWYTRTWFKGLVIVIVAALVIFTQRYELFGFITTLFGTGIVATLASFAIKFSIAFLVQFTAQLALGDSFLATIVTFAAMALIGGFDLSQFLSNPMATIGQHVPNSVVDWVNSVSSVAKLGFDYYRREEMEKLQEEMEDWALTEQMRQKEYEDAWSGMYDSSKFADPYEELDRIKFGSIAESPAGYYDRALDMNPGVRSLDYVSNIHTAMTEVSTNLVLPTPLFENRT
jgi:hypothetical protein